MRTSIMSTRQQLLQQVRGKHPGMKGLRSPSTMPTPLKPTTVTSELPHTQLVTDPVSSLATAEYAFLDTQIIQAKELVANNIMPQTHADTMAVMAAHDAGAVTLGIEPGPLANNQNMPGQPQQFEAGPTPFLTDPMKPIKPAGM